MKYDVSLIMIVLLLGLSIQVYGGPVGGIPIPRLINSADLLVIGPGRPSSVGELDVSVEITVHRVLKGTIGVESKINALWSAPKAPNARVDPSKSVCGIWFLKLREQGGWQILPYATGDVIFLHTHIPISDGAIASEFAYSPDIPIIDKVISEMGAEIEKSAGKSRMLTGLFSSLTSTDSALSARLYSRFAKSSVPRLKAYGLSHLILQGNGEALAQLVNDKNALEAAAQDPGISSSICNGRGQDAQYIETLGKLIAPDANTYLRKCAAYALRAIHSKETLVYLAQLCDSESQELRYDCVIGMASFANSLPVQNSQNLKNMGWTNSESKGPYTTDETLKNFPSLELYNQEEPKYVGFWKKWWAENKATLLR